MDVDTAAAGAAGPSGASAAVSNDVQMSSLEELGTLESLGGAHDGGFGAASSSAAGASSASGAGVMGSPSAAASSGSAATAAAPAPPPEAFLWGTITDAGLLAADKRLYNWMGQWGLTETDFIKPAGVTSDFAYQFVVHFGGNYVQPLHEGKVSHTLLPSKKDHAAQTYPYSGHYQFKVKQKEDNPAAWEEMRVSEGKVKDKVLGQQQYPCKLRFGGDVQGEVWRPSPEVCASMATADADFREFPPNKDLIGVTGSGKNPFPSLGDFTLFGAYHPATGRIWMRKQYVGIKVKGQPGKQAAPKAVAGGAGAGGARASRGMGEVTALASDAARLAAPKPAPSEFDLPVKLEWKEGYVPPKDVAAMMDVYTSIRNNKFRPVNFIKPVDSAQVPDYYERLASAGREPMWLEEVERKLVNGEYPNYEVFKSDMQRIWDNAKFYNKPETQYHQDALYYERELSRKIEYHEKTWAREAERERKKREEEEEKDRAKREILEAKQREKEVVERQRAEKRRAEEEKRAARSKVEEEKKKEKEARRVMEAMAAGKSVDQALRAAGAGDGSSLLGAHGDDDGGSHNGGEGSTGGDGDHSAPGSAEKGEGGEDGMFAVSAGVGGEGGEGGSGELDEAEQAAALYKKKQAEREAAEKVAEEKRKSAAARKSTGGGGAAGKKGGAAASGAGAGGGTGDNVGGLADQVVKLTNVVTMMMEMQAKQMAAATAGNVGMGSMPMMGMGMMPPGMMAGMMPQAAMMQPGAVLGQLQAVQSQIQAGAGGGGSKKSSAAPAASKSAGSKRAYNADEDDFGDDFDDDDVYSSHRKSSGGGRGSRGGRASTGAKRGRASTGDGRGAGAASSYSSKAAAPAATSSSSSSANVDWTNVPLTYEEKQTLSEDAGKLQEAQMDRLMQLLQEERLLGESPSGEVELDMDTMPPATLRRMQRIVNELLGKPAPNPGGAKGKATPAAAAGGGRAGTRGASGAGGGSSHKDLIAAAATAAQERVSAMGSSGVGTQRTTVFDDDDDAPPPPAF